MNFNSIKVQLERQQDALCRCCLQLFQFHKGTIRTRPQYALLHEHKYFNSIKVQLEQASSSVQSAFSYNFNSIKVQLEHDVFSFLAKLESHFNSIKVQLEHCVYAVVKCVYRHFNSIKVQLEPCCLGLPCVLRWFQFHKGTIRTCYDRLSFYPYLISIP